MSRACRTIFPLRPLRGTSSTLSTASCGWGSASCSSSAYLSRWGCGSADRRPGPSRLRRGVLKGTRELGLGLPQGPVTTFVARYANVLRIAVLAVAGMVLLFITPTAGKIILLAAIVVVLLLAIEAIRAPSLRASAPGLPKTG